MALTPEEKVRQFFIRYLWEKKGYPVGLMAVEKKIRGKDAGDRTDILAHDRRGEPVLLVECKAPDTKLDQAVFDQAARYDLGLNVGTFALTNGHEMYCCRVDHGEGRYVFLEDLPPFKKMEAG